MYQDSQATETPLQFDRDAKIVLAKNFYYGATDVQPYELSAYEISTKMNTLKTTQDFLDRRNKQIENVAKYLKEILAERQGEVDDEFEQIAEFLDIELSRKVRVELSFSVSAYLELPLGIDPSDIRAYDFRIDGLDYEGDGELIDWSCDDNDIEAADFDE